MHNPIQELKKNWNQAKTHNDPNADYCALATVSNKGQPSVRMLVLREVTEDSFIVFFSQTSPKWDQLQQSQQYEILIFWPTLMRQYRIRGEVDEVAIDEIQYHWQKKPYNAKIVDHFYTRYQPQSSVISSREKFLEGVESLQREYPDDKEIPFPGSAKGVALKATSIEEWRGTEDRLHERYLYTLEEDRWLQHVLIP